MDLLAQECRVHLQGADKLAAAESHILDESEQEAAGLQAERSQLGCNPEKHRMLGWLEGRCSWAGNKGPEHPAGLDHMVQTALGPLGPPDNHAAAQLPGLI